MTQTYEFAKDFIWGAATAAFQIEGGYNEDGKSESIWDRFCKTPLNVEGYVNGNVACDHYHRLDEDVQMMKDLGLKSYRFSISWCRVIPNGVGEANELGLAFYETLIDKLLEAGIEPCITLYHWDLPQVLQDKGGFANREIVSAFKAYAEVIFKRFGHKVKRFITFNEPWVITMLGYGEGVHAPGIRDFSMALLANHHLYLAHGETVRLYRDMKLDGKIGMTLNMTHAYPANPNDPLDVLAASRHDGYVNRWFADPLFKGEYPKDMIEVFEASNVVVPKFSKEDMEIIATPTDFLGINYYSGAYLKHNEVAYPTKAELVSTGFDVTQMDWQITPQAFTDLLVTVQKTYNPKSIIITENGAAFNDVIDMNQQVEDPRRIDYLKRHFVAMHEAILQGVKLDGYYVWSLMDNFEWAFGYRPRFGIVHVDYKTLKRTVKQSAIWYKGVIESNGFEV
ncbi:MAG: GH1 family beta-glucosidase [Turicibacter sp.]